ncbi:CoA-transferase subunit beta [Histidinibacterium lentulum]|uniref:CoA-transferase subunit beta n=1 Tax=Histidinibacterium lentulum TaxID=2480588 RepID=A0A3N2QRG7_9RHOB|nr:CoA-transferase [Histidinibacterium lentulum]ROT97808.1 CoA-transferase subunit beta [Histidinibacterium lentulum]
MTALGETARIALAAARELADGESCFVGIGIPSDAALLARRSHAPRLGLIYESGVFGADPPGPPLSTGSPEVAAGAAMIADGLTAFGELQAGRISCALLSAAQVDRFGNLNSTVLGPYEAPKLRMVGSGGAHDIACLARRLIVVMPHDPRRFVERVDFATSPGAAPRDTARRRALGLGPGPSVLITGRGRFEMTADGWRLAATLPGFSAADALEGLPWGTPPGPVPGVAFDAAALSALAALPHLHEPSPAP